MKVGFFGKLPGYGDFVQRNVSPELISEWDNWLIQAIDTSQAQLKGDWREIYFTSPIWCFTIQANIIFPSTLSGLMMPSVDSAGRDYPFFVFCELTGKQNVFSVCSELDAMHKTCEEFLLSLLAKSRPDLDDIAHVLQQHYAEYPLDKHLPEPDSNSYTHGELLRLSSPRKIHSFRAHEAFTSHILSMQNTAISIWSHSVSEQQDYTQRYFAGMPPVQAFTSFLTQAG